MGIHCRWHCRNQRLRLCTRGKRVLPHSPHRLRLCSEGGPLRPWLRYERPSTSATTEERVLVPWLGYSGSYVKPRARILCSNKEATRRGFDIRP